MSSSSTAAVRVPTRPIVRTVRERPQPRLRVVAPAPRRPAGGLALLSVCLLGLGLLVLLLLNISIGKGAYALTELQHQQRQLVEDKQALSEQVEQVSAPQRLAEQARKLGMVPNPNTAFAELPDGRVKGKPQMAEAPPKPRPARAAASKAPDRSKKTPPASKKTPVGSKAPKTDRASKTPAAAATPPVP